MKLFDARTIVLCRVLAILLLAVACSSPLLAADEVTIQLTAQKVVVAKDGTEQLLSADQAQPGDLIQYTAVYRNETKGPVHNLQPQLAIPADTEYLPGSEKPAGAVASADGKTFAALPLKRTVKTADGEKTEPVPAADYRVLRWTLSELADGQTFTASVRTHILATTTPSPGATTH